jgi:hypothetical protein
MSEVPLTHPSSADPGALHQRRDPAELPPLLSLLGACKLCGTCDSWGGHFFRSLLPPLDSPQASRLSLGTQPTLGFQTVAISMVMKALQGGFGRPLLSEEVRCLHLLLGRVYLRHESCNLSEREIMRASSSSISSRSDAFRLSRGTSPRRNPFPLEPFRRPMHRVLGVSSGGGGVLRSEVPM